MNANPMIDAGNPLKPPEYREVVPLATSDGAYDLQSDAAFWRLFWHPVCTLRELHEARAGRRGPLQTTLLGEKVAVAEISGKVVAFADRCPHRGAELSLGWLGEESIRCRYHGWCFAPDGSCIDIPSLADGDIVPARAKLEAYDCEVRYGWVWVRMDGSADSTIPVFPAWEDESQRCIMGEPYLWPASAGRRVENFIDVSHFPYAHQGTLGAPPYTRFPLFPIDRERGALRWETETFLAFNPGDATYGPPTGPESVMLPPARYEVIMPLTVVLDFRWSETKSTQIFMHPTPVDAENCRSYWYTCHTDDGSPDEEHLELQSIVLTEDLPVVASHSPRAIGELRDEVSVPADKPVVYWRRWLFELMHAARESGAAVRSSLDTTRREEKPAVVESVS